MTTLDYSDYSEQPAPTPVATTAAATSRQWRSIWRIHFYSGIFAIPFILFLSVTGLVILYTQPIENLLEGDIRTVDRGAEIISFDEQAAAVEAAYPDGTVLDLTPPADPGGSSRFFVDDGSARGLHVFVDPYTAEVLGDSKPGGGIIGLSNRLHGNLNNEAITLPVPAVAALWDGGPVMRDYVVGDMVLEIMGIWVLALVGTGLYLWWPRKSRWSKGSKGERRLLGIRRGATGRARWRDLHGLGGIALLAVMVLTLVSGMAWSSYWSEQFASFADKVTPGDSVDAPASSLGVRGDLDRFGNQIPWNTGDFPIPASYAPAADGTMPAPVRLDDMVAIAEEEGMKPGYTIAFPENTTDEAGNPLFGSYAMYNSWPRKTSEARDVFVDQFTGETLAEQSVYGYGALAVGMDTLVSTHMGTQLGLFTRIMMTLLCVLAIWSVISALVMFWKRRRPGTAGLPRRPADVRLSRGLTVAAVLLAIVYPLWGVSVLVILAIDRFVIRGIPPLRRTFGQA
jgi:uncharacterized iron-regulated membrane protein